MKNNFYYITKNTITLLHIITFITYIKHYYVLHITKKFFFYYSQKC